ncbi:unnamed protein product [Toxocara canis]|uniref:Uncharacterized protein n=1 Tax=Toxocara canis TaxID=6265 RepID=A0A183U8S2_TOXCA|nr:unnamed protein product [Toxocara canis]
MIRQYANATASTSAANSANGTSHQDLNGSNVAAKVAEVFLTAGHAFQKLGDLTLQLHSSNDNAGEKLVISRLSTSLDCLPIRTDIGPTHAKPFSTPHPLSFSFEKVKGRSRNENFWARSKQ